MHLSSFGLISIKGSVTKLEPGLGFADYQIAMANHSASIALQSRLGKEPGIAQPLETTKSSASAPALPSRNKINAEELFNPPVRSAASALVRKFRT